MLRKGCLALALALASTAPAAADARSPSVACYELAITIVIKSMIDAHQKRKDVAAVDVGRLLTLIEVTADDWQRNDGPDVCLKTMDRARKDLQSSLEELRR